VVENGERWRAWLPRILAPLAFFAAATVLVVVVNRSLNADAGQTATTPPAAGTDTSATTNEGTTTNRGGKKRFYRVRNGDFLETIAQRFDTTVEDLLALNPNLDPNSLQPGERIRVR
jgi:LysM repeat protein